VFLPYRPGEPAPGRAAGRTLPSPATPHPSLPYYFRSFRDFRRAHQWSKKLGDATSQEVDGLASANGDVYATGTFAGSVNLGGSTLASAGLNDVFLVKLNSAGTHQWSQRYGDASSQYGSEHVRASNQPWKRPHVAPKRLTCPVAPTRVSALLDLERVPNSILRSARTAGARSDMRSRDK
jgi:hypothetical protein